MISGMSDGTEMLEGANLEQAATVLWWPDDEVATRANEFKRARGSRQFGTLRAALLFVLETLSDNERRTALVELYFWPFELDFSRPEVLEASKSWHGILR